MSKRICMVAYTHYRTDARPRREAEALAARGDEVDFLALHEDDAPAEENLGGVRVIGLDTRRYRGGSGAKYLLSYGEFFARAMAELTRRHLRRRYDVVHVHTMPDFIVFVTAAVKLMGAKVVLDVHDTMPELYQSKFGVGRGHPLIRVIALQERLATLYADKLIAVHEPHKRLLESRGARPDKISVLLNLPDPRIFGGPLNGRAPGQEEAEPVRLVYHGTVAERLGLDLAVRAFARVREELSDARFDIYGSGDAGPRVQALIEELGLGGCVHFSNKHFRVDEVPRLLAGASLGVVPNRDDPATRYMLPVKLLEYVYLGIPAVAPRLEAIRHYFDDDAVGYYDAGDVDSLARTILAVLRDPARRARMREAAEQFAERFSWDVMKKDLYAVVDA